MEKNFEKIREKENNLNWYAQKPRTSKKYKQKLKKAKPLSFRLSKANYNFLMNQSKKDKCSVTSIVEGLIQTKRLENQNKEANLEYWGDVLQGRQPLY